MMNSDSKWCFWRWKYITPPGMREVYLTRLYLLETPYGGIKLHWIHRPDNDRHLHDHPWWFLSIVLWGHYDEEVPEVYQTWMGPKVMHNRKRMQRIRWGTFKKPEQFHRIARLAPRTLTLVITGPKVREWGFQTETGWIHWKKYLGVR